MTSKMKTLNDLRNKYQRLLEDYTLILQDAYRYQNKSIRFSPKDGIDSCMSFNAKIFYFETLIKEAEKKYKNFPVFYSTSMISNIKYYLKDLINTYYIDYMNQQQEET